MTIKVCNFCSSTESKKVMTHHDNNCYVDSNDFNLVCCKNCGLVRIEDPPSSRVIGKYYPKHYYAYGTNRNIFFILKNVWVKFANSLPKFFAKRILFSQLYFYPNGTNDSVLDVGCGDGSALRMLQKLGFQKLNGTEIDDDNCRMIEKTYGYDIKQTFTIRSILGIKYNAIRMNHVLEHVYDPAETIAKAGTLLKKDGRFFIAVPNFRSLASRVFGKYYCGLQMPTHLYHFDIKVLRGQLEKEGFKVVKKRTVGMSGFAFSLLTLLRDKYGYVAPRFISVVLVFVFIPLELILNLLGQGFMLNIEAKKLS